MHALKSAQKIERVTFVPRDSPDNVPDLEWRWHPQVTKEFGLEELSGDHLDRSSCPGRVS